MESRNPPLPPLTGGLYRYRSSYLRSLNPDLPGSLMSGLSQRTSGDPMTSGPRPGSPFLLQRWGFALAAILPTIPQPWDTVHQLVNTSSATELRLQPYDS